MVDFYENIKLNFNVCTAGDFKSGPEPYTRNSMSDADKLAWNELANPMWEKMTSIMETGRDLPKGSIQNYGDNAMEMMTTNPETAEVAKNLGLVDHVVTREELKAWMFSEYPNDENDRFSFPDSISIYDYLSTLDKKENKSSNNIAVINVEGAIMTGDAAYGVAGSDTIVKNIQSATTDKSVKAMVLRVNSPVGVDCASDLITHSLTEFKETGRPIISSIGALAASGGVWVTTNSDESWAEEDTLTGSIGVYGIVPTLDGIYDWAGIKVDGVSSTKAGEWDEREAMPENITNLIQSSIDRTYDKFVSKVAENRGMLYEDVLPIAGGRIWAGYKALELGLVDKIGDLEDAYSHFSDDARIEDINQPSDTSFSLKEGKKNDEVFLNNYEIQSIDEWGYPDYLEYEEGTSKVVLSWWKVRLIRKSDKKKINLPVHFQDTFNDDGKIIRRSIYYSQKILEN